jgi:hypothetical protein
MGEEGIIHGDTPMRLLLPSLVVAATLAAPAVGFAQSAYDYPYCGVYTSNLGAGGAMSCYYRSYGECMATMRGLGYCTQSPYYGHGPNQQPRTRRRNY